MFFKRLYFTTHNQYLCYCRPAKALPPPSPRMSLSESSSVPSASEIVQHTPLVYAIDPNPLEDGAIKWIRHGNAASKQKRDMEAYKEASRNTNNLLSAEGYINLSHVVRVQNVHRGNSPADESVDEGPDVNFHQEVSGGSLMGSL